MKVSVGQFSPGGELAENLAVMRRLAKDAQGEGSRLIIFPEESMFSVGQVAGNFADAVAAQWTSFVQGLSLLAAEVGIAVIAGGYEASADARPYNTVVAVDDDGAIVGTYRKLHLYDAFSYQESRRIRPGDKGVSVVDIGGFRVGIMTCYDIRFPEQARALALADADVIAVAAAWFKGDYKVEHWETLLKARAIENTVWIAAAGSSSDHCIGHSVIFDPMGIAHSSLAGEAQGVVTTDISHRRIEEVREFLPVLANRRFESATKVLPAE